MSVARCPALTLGYASHWPNAVSDGEFTVTTNANTTVTAADTVSTASAATASSPSSNGARQRSSSRRVALGAANVPRKPMAISGVAIPSSSETMPLPTVAPQYANANTAAISSANLLGEIACL